MARGTRKVYPGKRNKRLSSTFQPPEESRSVQQPKRCDKHGDKDEDNSLKNVNNEQFSHLIECKQKTYWEKTRQQLHKNAAILKKSWKQHPTKQ